MSKFAVVIFRDEKKAYEGLHALQELHAEGSLTVFGTCVLQRDTAGKVSVLKGEDAGPVGTAVGALAGGLVGLFGGPAGAAAGAILGGTGGIVRDVVHVEVSDEFLQAIEHELAPGDFAVVAEMSEDWVAPLDTRMQELGGEVVREERETFRDELIERRVRAEKAELARRKAEHARRKAERAAERAGSKAEKQQQALNAEIDDARKKLAKMADKAERRLDDVKQEFSAKLQALQDQAARAKPEVRSRIDERIAEIRREFTDREQALTRAKELTDEALRP